MNKKSVAALIAFVAAFGLSAFLMSFFALPVREVKIAQLRKPSSAGEKILRLLEQDIRNGERTSTRDAFYGNSAPVALDRYTEAVKTYADLSGSMDDSDLPRDFQRAWRKHMQAWRVKSEMLKAEQFSPHDRRHYCDFEAAYELQGEEINSTWYEVLGVAGKYGAFPADAYR